MTNQSLELFSYDSQQQRTIVEGENILFCLSDLCRILGIINAPQMADSIDKDDIYSRYTADSLGRSQDINFVNESGLYQAIFQSRKPESKKFKRWVMSEVLPSIRRTGTYGIQKELSRKEILQMALEAEEKVEVLEAKIEETQPDLDYLEGIRSSASTFSWLEVSDRIGIGRNTMLKHLKRLTVLMSDLSPYERYSKLGWFHVRVSPYTKPDGKQYTSNVTECYERGIEGISKFLRKHGIECREYVKPESKAIAKSC